LFSTAVVLASTFQLTPGFGPRREQRLWGQGIACWATCSTRPMALPARVTGAAALRGAAAVAQDALARGDADRLAHMLPSGEHWRMFADFADGAAYLDIETGDDRRGVGRGISAIGLFDRDGPRILLAGRDLHLFPQIARGLRDAGDVSNGLSFDVPILCRAFPDWKPPACHVDLRHVLARVGTRAGSRRIERECALEKLRLARPPHLARLDGWDAARLWRLGCGPRGDKQALRLFAEYNLHDCHPLADADRVRVQHAGRASGGARRARARAPGAGAHARATCCNDVSKVLLRL